MKNLDLKILQLRMDSFGLSPGKLGFSEHVVICSFLHSSKIQRKYQLSPATWAIWRLESFLLGWVGLVYTEPTVCMVPHGQQPHYGSITSWKVVSGKGPSDWLVRIGFLKALEEKESQSRLGERGEK